MSEILLHQNIESMVKIMPRLEALYYFVYELAECFHADEGTLSRIKTGILDNQILKSIYLTYKDSSGNEIGTVVIHIDWDKHFLLVDTDEGKYIEFDLSKSIVDNIVDWKKIVVTHINEIMKQFNVVEVNGSYIFRSHLYETEEIYAKTREIMQTVLPSEQSNENKKVNADFQAKVNNILTNKQNLTGTNGTVKTRTFECGCFKEVSVDVSYNLYN